MWTSPAIQCYSMAYFWQSEVILVKLQSWADARSRARINANMLLIHHQLTSKVIQSNYREGEQHPRSNVTADGHPAEQQVVFVRSKHGCTQRARQGGEIWDQSVAMSECVHVCTPTLPHMTNLWWSSQQTWKYRIVVHHLLHLIFPVHFIMCQDKGVNQYITSCPRALLNLR